MTGVSGGAGLLGGGGHWTRDIVFSPDGKYLAATFGVGGLRVWDTASWQLVLDDQEYNGQRSDDAVFDRNGNLYTVAYDGLPAALWAGLQGGSEIHGSGRQGAAQHRGPSRR